MNQITMGNTMSQITTGNTYESNYYGWYTQFKLL